jgi:hypothetical protein
MVKKMTIEERVIEKVMDLETKLENLREELGSWYDMFDARVSRLERRNSPEVAVGGETRVIFDPNPEVKDDGKSNPVDPT